MGSKRKKRIAAKLCWGIAAALVFSVGGPVPKGEKYAGRVFAEEAVGGSDMTFYPAEAGNEPSPTGTGASDLSVGGAENQNSVPSTDVNSGHLSAGGAEIRNEDISTEEEIIHQPKLILESNNLSEEKIQCGSEREFVTCFRNRSRTDAILNLSVSVKPAEESISLKAASFYFDSVAPQEVIAISTVVRVSPAAEQKKTSVEFTFSYENDKGLSYTSSETAFLETFQPVQTSMEGFDLAEKVYSMETVSPQIQVHNTGHAPIYNAQVTLSAPGLFPVGAVHAGNLEAGASYGGSVKLYVGNKNMASISDSGADTGKDGYGSVTGTLTLSYEDAFGQAYTQTQEFTTYIKEPEIIELSVEKEVETNSWWPPILLMTILFFSTALAILGWRLWKSRRKLEDLLLEERIYERERI